VFEFIGIFAVVYFIIIGVGRIFGRKRPKREYYIIREYEIDDETEQGLEELLDRGVKRRTEPSGELPDNVVSIKHRRRQKNHEG